MIRRTKSSRPSAVQAAGRPRAAKRLLVLASTAVAAFLVVVAIASAIGHIYPSAHAFKGESSAVSFKYGATTLATCRLTVTGESTTQLAGQVTFSSCTNPRGGTASATTGKWFFGVSPTFGVPTKNRLETGSALTVIVDDSTYHCTITAKSGYLNTAGDAWENGLNSPLVNSQSELNEQNMPSTWTGTEKGGCSVGTNPPIAVVTGSSSPMVWTDTTDPTQTILIGS